MANLAALSVVPPSSSSSSFHDGTWMTAGLLDGVEEHHHQQRGHREHSCSAPPAPPPPPRLALDLRQYGAVTARDLELLPRNLRRLSLGPYFAPSLTTRAVVEAVPVSCLTHLHLDLSRVLRDDDAVERDAAVVRLLQRCRAGAGPAPGASLQHLTLRLRPPAQDGVPHGGDGGGGDDDGHAHRIRGSGGGDALLQAMPGDGLARTLARHWPNGGGGSNLRSLNLDGNLIGDAGVQALVQALSSSASSSDAAAAHATFHLQHLGLSNNLITSLSCQILASLLASTTDGGGCQLKSLDLSHSAGIGPDGLLILVQALQGNASLQHISWVGCGQMLMLPHHETVIYERLLDLLEHHNTTLVSIGVPSSAAASTHRRSSRRYRNRDDTTTIAATDPQGQLLRRQKEQLACWLLLNRSGRYLLRQQPRGDDVAPLPTGLWPHVFARASQIEQRQQQQHQQEASADDVGRATAMTTTMTTTTTTTKVAPNCMFYLLRNTVGQAWAIAPDEKRS